MSESVEQTRHELFEAWYVTDCFNGAQITITQQQVSELRGPHGDYRERAALHGKWVGFNAALDAVVIDLSGVDEYDGWQAVDSCRAAIESAGLGITIK